MECFKQDTDADSVQRLTERNEQFGRLRNRVVLGMAIAMLISLWSEYGTERFINRQNRPQDEAIKAISDYTSATVLKNVNASQPTGAQGAPPGSKGNDDVSNQENRGGLRSRAPSLAPTEQWNVINGSQPPEDIATKDDGTSKEDSSGGIVSTSPSLPPSRGDVVTQGDDMPSNAPSPAFHSQTHDSVEEKFLLDKEMLDAFHNFGNHSFRNITEEMVKDRGMVAVSPLSKGEQKRAHDLCHSLRNDNYPRDSSVLVYNISKSRCGKLTGMEGAGNVILDYVGNRLTTLTEGNTSFLFDCGFDAFDVRHNLVFPWLSGYFPARSLYSDELPFGVQIPGELANDTTFCPARNGRRLNPSNKLPLKLVSPLINHDLRRMAVAAVGVPDPDHPSAAFERDFLREEVKLPPYAPNPATGVIYRLPIHDFYENGPIFPNVSVDDVAIHFRCGDVLMGANGPFYYPKYEEYAKQISPEVRSIGIITQPFSDGEGMDARGRDNLAKSGARCRIVVEGLIDYLRHRFPKATYSIHNGAGETTMLAYSRLIMANQSFGLIPSTFSTFPVMASFGTGYLTNCSQSQLTCAGYFLTNEMTQDMNPNQPVVLDILEQSAGGKKLSKLWGKENENAKDVLKWFSDPNMPLP